MQFERIVMSTSNLCSKLAASLQVLPSPPPTTMIQAATVLRYTFASRQGCNDIHVSLKCAADVWGGECAGDNLDTGSD